MMNKCWSCRKSFTKKNSCLSVRERKLGLCRSCAKLRARRIYGHKPKNNQAPRKFHCFPCGCSGRLPLNLNSVNKLAYKGKSSKSWSCRVSKIISSNRIVAKELKYKPINPSTPHPQIRKLMEEPNCERCGERLSWNFGRGKTPHLHHDHETGEIYGFTHPLCNPRALEDEIEVLRKEIKRLTALVSANLKSQP